MDDGLAAALRRWRAAARHRRPGARALVLLAAWAGACRNSSNDGSGDGGIPRPGSDVPALAAGVEYGVFGVPGPDNGVEDPVLLVGCPASGQVAVEVVYLQPDQLGAIDQGTFLAQLVTTGAHEHLAVGSAGQFLTVDFDATGSGSDAPFLYPATVTADPSFLVTAMHSFQVHALNPAQPALDSLGAWNSYMLSDCRAP